MIHCSTTLGHRMVSYYRGFLNSEVCNREGPLHLCLFCYVCMFVCVHNTYVYVHMYVPMFIYVVGYACMYIICIQYTYVPIYIILVCMYVCIIQYVHVHFVCTDT